jgi:hypothetical protein
VTRGCVYSNEHEGRDLAWDVGLRDARCDPGSSVAAATGNEKPVVDPFFMLSGALLTDSFDGPELNTNLWSRPAVALG